MPSEGFDQIQISCVALHWKILCKLSILLKREGLHMCFIDLIHVFMTTRYTLKVDCLTKLLLSCFIKLGTMFAI